MNNLQETIRRILREETDEYRENVRVKISDIQPTNRDGQSIEDAIINVKDGLTSYSQDPPFLLKRGDKYEILDGFHRIAQKILDGKKYVTSDVMIKESIRRILREETEGYKLNLVKKIIYTLYDNISFIKQSTFNGKPLLIIYFDSDDTAANIESWFDEKISRDIDEWNSGNIVVCPSWVANWDSRKKNADVYINTELIKYDNLGNVVNESVLREELSPRVRRRITPDEMEKEFLESFESAYDLTKRRRILRAHFLDELIYTTISMMMDGFHWRFTSTIPEDEFWYDDIHTGLQNHYKDRIIQMYNERQEK